MDIEKLKAEFEQSEGFKRLEHVAQYTFFEFGAYIKRTDVPADIEKKCGKLITSLLFSWSAWKEAKAQAVPEGFVLVPVKEIKEWYLDDSESIYREDPDWLCDISIGEVVEVEHRVSYELDQDPVFAAIQWDEENGDVGYYETFKTKAEAEKVAAHCKAMVEAQEPAND
jgi:hypothetical protein